MQSLLSTYRWILVLCAAGLLVSTLEYWAVAGCFNSDGVYSWEILRLRTGVPCLPRIRFFHAPQIRAMAIVQGIALLLALLVPFRSAAFSIALGMLVLSNLVLIWRRGFGEDGSETMSAIILLTLLLCVGPQSTPFLLRAGLWFLAFQACLSYASSGLGKLGSPAWRRGDAILRILSTRTYGWDAGARLLEHRLLLRRCLSWLVIGMEVAFPLVLVLPAPWLWIFLAWGLLFHVACALIMGFNSFVWVFVATYPAVISTSALIAGSAPMSRLLALLTGH